MNQGFTLIELLVVVLIVGILSAVALPQYQTAVERARATEALTQMSAMRSAMERFHSQHERWPTSFDELDVDIPVVTECEGSGHGGKHFCLSLNGATITATRRLGGDKQYTLTTTIQENENGTYAATRSCSPNTGDSDAASYCNAISGGKPTGF